MSSFNQVPRKKSPVEAFVSQEEQKTCGGFSALVDTTSPMFEVNKLSLGSLCCN